MNAASVKRTVTAPMVFVRPKSASATTIGGVIFVNFVAKGRKFKLQAQENSFQIIMSAILDKPTGLASAK